jgi:tRNA/tmRNA/rRNA uracil-C5-methylase (TrmA/RlmC/RlmD family)
VSGAIGDLVELELDRPAHGGFCVGRFEGQVVFTRHGIPGERVRAEITEIGSGGRFLRADVVEVLEASPDRRDPVCPHAQPGGCGGCDWQHVAIERQRSMKAEIVREQMIRVGRMSADDPLLTRLAVEPCGDDADGFGYRTRMDFVADHRGRLGLRAARSHEVIPLRSCPLAVDAISEDEAMRQPWLANATVRFAAAADGVAVMPEGAPPITVHEMVGDAGFDVSADGFWQVHRNAPAVFTQIAAEMLEPAAGDFLVDLFGGVGLFARVLGAKLGAGGRVVLVEADARASRLARRNLRSLPQAQVVAERVDRWLRQRTITHADLVVLDPPRAGAGKDIMTSVLRLRPRRVLYVACDPASLARDVALARDLGYRLAQLRAVDAFPQTQHVETFALFVADDGDAA